MRVLRHLLSILVLPFTVVVVVPRWMITSLVASDTRWTAGTSSAVLAHVAGVLLFAVGFALFAWCVALFARVGKGTLAPWDPPTCFVAVGPYRHVRNPMICGVLTMVSGEALYLGSLHVAQWAMLFFLINQAYFMLSEEPGLRRRFGESYDIYRDAVPRWLPRVTPWSGM